MGYRSAWKSPSSDPARGGKAGRREASGEAGYRAGLGLGCRSSGGDAGVDV